MVVYNNLTSRARQLLGIFYRQSTIQWANYRLSTKWRAHMKYAAEIFMGENKNSVFRLYTGQAEGQFISFCYDVGDLLVVAINIANDKDAYKEERKFRIQCLKEAPLVQVEPGVVIPNWLLTDSASPIFNLATFTAAVESMPEEHLHSFASSSYPFIPDNPWERGEHGFEAHYSFDRMAKATRISFQTLFDALLYDAFEVKKYHVKPTRAKIAESCSFHIPAPMKYTVITFFETENLVRSLDMR